MDIVIRCSHDNNLGDRVANNFIMSAIAGQQVKFTSMSLHEKTPSCLGIGSILHFALKDDAVWGSGFICDNETCIEKPKQIYAVRGQLSRQILLNHGIPCPEIYGDPALLFPRYYYPIVEKKYDLGIVPHYVDYKNENLKNFVSEKILIIDIKSGYQNVITSMLSCKKIVSSALHGIIVADAYGIPAMWLEFSDKVVGNGFKFRDYFLSVQRKDTESLRITPKTTLENLYNLFYDYKINIDLDLLLNECPFNPKGRYAI